MTSETQEYEERKRTLKIHKYLQRHKRLIGWILGVALVLSVLGFVPHFSASVSCYDPSIRLPFRSDTISARMLICITLAVPFVTMAAVEWAFHPANDGKSLLRQSLRRSWSYVGDLLVGGLFMFFINDLAKIATSEARPCFWSLCSPNINEEQCQQQYVSISWKDCTNPLNMSHARLIDSMKSFPSGHASVSVYSAFFMIAYMQQRACNKSYRLLVPFIQLGWAVWSLYCCQTRIWDNKHHWWDVLAGAFLGAFGAFLSLKYLSNWFIREEVAEKKEKLETEKLQQQDTRT